MFNNRFSLYRLQKNFDRQLLGEIFKKLGN